MLDESSGPLEDGPQLTNEGTCSTPIVPYDTKDFAALSDHALAYSRGGWNVIPLHSAQGGTCSCGAPECGKPGKHARVREWPKLSCDPATVAGWWKQWPNANIGLRLDGLTVLDVDGAEGWESLAAMEVERGILDACARQRSGSGGWHYLFKAVSGVDKRIGFRPGLDLLTGPGCYICCAPSLHASGGRYEWVDQYSPLATHRDQIPLTVPPDWLLRAASNEKPKTSARGKQPTAERVPAERILAQALEKIRAGSGRNDAGLWYLGQLRDNRYTKDEAYLTLREWVTRANELTPGQEKYALAEAQATLRSAYSREARQPWNPDPGKRPNTARILEELSEDIELFHSPKGEAFTLVPVNDHVECWAVDSKTFKGILTSAISKGRMPHRAVKRCKASWTCCARGLHSMARRNKLICVSPTWGNARTWTLPTIPGR